MAGSTNATLTSACYCPCYAANVDLSLEDHHDPRTYHLADLKPSGQYVLQTSTKSVVPAVMKYLLANGFLHGDRITCTGKTVAENLAGLFADLTPGQKVIMPLENPKRAMVRLSPEREPAPDGAVAAYQVKVRRHVGPAKVF